MDELRDAVTLCEVCDFSGAQEPATKWVKYPNDIRRWKLCTRHAAAAIAESDRVGKPVRAGRLYSPDLPDAGLFEAQQPEQAREGQPQPLD